MAVQEKILTGELIIAEEQYPALYKDSGLQKYLDLIREEVAIESESLDLDPNTDKGRKNIGSLARKVSSSKTCIEKPGREYLKQLKAKVRPAEQEIRRFVDTVDAIRDSILAPRVEWEQKEQERIQAHKDHIESLNEYRRVGSGADLDVYKDLLENASAFVVDDSLEEFKAEAAHIKERAVGYLEAYIKEREKYEQEQAELAQLRREKAEREAKEEAERTAKEAKEREERIAREAAERAQREAEEKARDEREAMEKREAELKAAAEMAEQNRITIHRRNIGIMRQYLNTGPESSARLAAMIEHVKTTWREEEYEEFTDEAGEAYKESHNHLVRLLNEVKQREEESARIEAERIQRETEERFRQEAEAKRQAEEEVQRKREENKRHCGAINRAARDALVLNCGLSTDKAKQVVEAIAKGMIDNVQIKY